MPRTRPFNKRKGGSLFTTDKQPSKARKVEDDAHSSPDLAKSEPIMIIPTEELNYVAELISDAAAVSVMSLLLEESEDEVHVLTASDRKV